jgi:protein required for attachment to host cells
MTHHKLSHGAWVFVGDGRKALFLINEGEREIPQSAPPGGRGATRTRLLMNSFGAGSNITDDICHRPSVPFFVTSIRCCGGGIRSAVEETDWHELEKERFAASIADRINRAALTNAFDQIVIVAPPKILGELRREFAKETEAKIVAEIPKDLTNHTILQIERLLTAE